MPIDRLYLVGAGGHAKVVLDALALATGAAKDIVVVDDERQRVGGSILGHPICARPLPDAMANSGFHLAIGKADIRAALHETLIAVGARPVTIWHPAATVAAAANIGDGSFLAAQAVIAPDARIGEGVIINHGAIVDHDCVVGDFAHIAPNATLGGGAEIGSAVLVGAGATILPGVRIGARAVIAAGATIVRDVPAGETVIFALARKK